ncbi:MULTISPECIES: hypothetical protein [unclassified Novosphingobium]|uniref:hypothetical protein n=1 Tax=unclassified Novosphingobium TaxID=2644732 RepID=UPI00086849A2|nr:MULTISPECIES: hypothetical protein [unclassified Novosphingobium]MBN9145312.1 hypothetical protein [Novosphingobium sp.]MDR6709692.1 2-polyprenyl-6-methoxyphenol hydroxylase-like FAD-dependent oxidoreductase [Novosphingobium sp. 1748]ODU80310.1 MAG: hypothetical protein ABT10_18090 [Novosphingobium sp. SCN 63-17]OJX88752.1 MAG: hypothetical protein BGP00_01625 [Novosphingobium sp. 63-713]
MSQAPRQSVLIRGGGLAGACATHLLRGAGFAIAHEPVRRSPVPVIMLSDAALGLIRDAFGRRDLFADAHRIAQRVVRWGHDPVAMPHGAVVVSEDDLIAALGGELAGDADAPAPMATLHCAPPFPDAELMRFGQRRAMAARILLRAGADHATCHVEAVAQGWLFLIPSGPTQCWLLGVGAPLDRLLENSVLIAPLIAGLGESSPGFETAPRQLAQLAGPNWLACGMAAIAFDPICGDGSAQSVREAILAAAVIAHPGDRHALATHYHSMLTASLRRHIQISGQFYATGGDSPWWREQVAALAQGYAWTTAQLAHMPEPRYLLRGFQLIEREAAT